MKKFIPCLNWIFLFFIFSCAFNAKQTRSSLESRHGEAWDALQFFNTSRAFPFKDIPADAYTKAYQKYKENFVNSSLRTHPSDGNVQSAAWQSIGPTNLGGRTLCIAFDPADTAIIWLGSASGGLWKSTTGGIGSNAWTYVNTGFPVRGVSCIAINPANRLEIYIGTGESYSYGTTNNGLVTRPTRGTVGIGILKSTDGGATWTHSLNWNYNQTSGIWDLIINPFLPSEVYAATTEGIFKTYNSGATWTQIFTEKMVMNLQIDPVDTTTLYAGVGNTGSANPGIYRTTNSGSTWTRLTSGLPAPTNAGRITICINPLNHNTVFALIADLYSTVGVYRSQNKGNTWTLRSNTEIVSYQGWYAKGLWMKTNDSTKLMFGGVYLFNSTNSGATINQVMNYNYHSDIHDIVSNPRNANKLYLLTDGGLFRSDDFGNNFYECTSGYVTSQWYIGSISSSNPNQIIAGAQDNYTNQFVGSSDWNLGIVGGDGSFNAINPTDDNIQYCSLQYLNVFSTTDQWVNGNQIISTPALAAGHNDQAFIAPFILCNSNLNIMYAGGDTLFRSNDAGNNWTPQGGYVDSGNVILTIAASSKDADSIYFATAPDGTGYRGVFRSSSGGTTLTNITGNLPNRYPRAMAVNPNDSRIVYIVFSGFGAGHVFKSINAGTTWTDISGSLPDVPFHCVEMLPATPETLFVGSDLGVFASLDQGATWFAFNTGLPDGVLIFDLKYSGSDNSLVAFSHGSGVYKTSLSNLSTGINQPVAFTHDFVQKIISNPVYLNQENQLSLQIQSGISGTAMISILDMNGRVIKASEHHSITAGRNIVEIDISALDAGIYFVKTDLGKETRVSKLVVVK